MAKRREIPAGAFKAECLGLLDEVAETGIEIVVTKRGIPVARVVPLEKEPPPSLTGSILREEDLVSPTGARWEADE